MIKLSRLGEGIISRQNAATVMACLPERALEGSNAYSPPSRTDHKKSGLREHAQCHTTPVQCEDGAIIMRAEQLKRKDLEIGGMQH